jgi:hypothetical protein
MSEPDAADRDGNRYSRTQITVAVITAIGAAVAAYFTGHATGYSPTHGTYRIVPSGNSAPAPNVVITVPQPASLGKPLPAVRCMTTVKGTAKLPRGEVLIIGNAEVGSKTYYYQPVSWPSTHQWVSSIYPGVPDETGNVFNVIAVVMPARLENWVAGAYETDRPPHGSSYLAAPGLPPSPAKVVQAEKVRRAPCG